MMVWLRAPEAGEVSVGIEDDVIPARDHARLVSLDEAWASTRAACEARVAEAQARADALLAQAAREADAQLAAAREAFETAAARGARQGRQDALAQWWSEADAALALRQSARLATREQVAALVVEAVSRIVRAGPPADLFARAAQTVERIINEGATVTVRVSADDYEAASSEFGLLASRWQALGRPVSVTVTPVQDLPPGTCVCQTEVGTIDASLDTQLRALAQMVQHSIEKPD